MCKDNESLLLEFDALVNDINDWLAHAQVQLEAHVSDNEAKVLN
jgi:hypothetical protein